MTNIIDTNGKNKQFWGVRLHFFTQCHPYLAYDNNIILPIIKCDEKKNH